MPTEEELRQLIEQWRDGLVKAEEILEYLERRLGPRPR